MIEIPAEDVFVFDEEAKDVIIKALRLLILVAEDEDARIATWLLDVLLPKENDDNSHS